MKCTLDFISLQDSSQTLALGLRLTNQEFSSKQDDKNIKSFQNLGYMNNSKIYEDLIRCFSLAKCSKDVLCLIHTWIGKSGPFRFFHFQEIN